MKNVESNPPSCKPKYEKETENERISDFKLMMNLNEVWW
jgi:hypothetical protein